MPIVASVGGQFSFGRQPARQGIVTSSLQIYLDANSAASYSGSGTTWSNIGPAGASYNFTLYNSPVSSNVTYNGATVRTISFDGTNDYASPTTSLVSLAQVNSWSETREAWVYWRGGAGNLYHENGAATPPDTNWFDAQGAMSNVYLTYSVWQGSVSMTPYIVYSNLTSNAWNHIVWQYNKATTTLMAYVNGVRTYSNAAVSRITPDSYSLQFFILLGAGSATNFGYGSASYLGMNLGLFRWYNRILGSNEIYQNFVAEKARFGV